MLKWFRKREYRSLGDALGDIQKELEALQPKDSLSITWSKSDSGITANVRTPQIGSGIPSEESTEANTPVSSGGGYNSYFKIVDKSTPMVGGGRNLAVGVIDGTGGGKSYVSINGKYYGVDDFSKVSFSVPQSTLPTVRFVYLVYSTTTRTFYITVTQNSPDMVGMGIGSDPVCLLGFVNIDTSKNMVIHQANVGVAHMLWIQDCEEPFYETT